MFYDQKYYESHYGRLLHDANYFELKSLFWKKNIFDTYGFGSQTTILDFGCGLGQVTAAMNHVDYFDISKFAVDWLRGRGKTAFDSENLIPKNNYEVLVSSHSLEHSLTPYQDLQNFRDYVIRDGKLILILPVETQYAPALHQDNDRHMQTWSFQNISNMLHSAGWTPVKQDYIYDSFGLEKLSKLVNRKSSISLSYLLGRKVFKTYKSMLIISKKAR